MFSNLKKEGRDVVFAMYTLVYEYRKRDNSVIC